MWTRARYNAISGKQILLGQGNIETFSSYLHPFIHSWTNAFIHLFTQPPIHFHIYSVMYSVMYSFFHSFIYSFIYLSISANKIFIINNELSSYGSYQDTRLTATRRYSHFYLHYFTHRCPYILRHKVHTTLELSREAVMKRLLIISRLHIVSDQNNIIMCQHNCHINSEVAIFFHAMNSFIHCHLLALLHIAHNEYKEKRSSSVLSISF